MQLDDLVLSIVKDFVSGNALFTALDVSNKVKESLPFARHREVRDLVRTAFVTDIEPANYARTPIQVNLANGDTVEALLYHPLADSWDLDNKYDAQKREQTALRPAQNVPAPVSQPVVVSTPSPVIPSNPATSVTKSNTPMQSLVGLPANIQWNQLFNNQPSLFPRK